MRPRMSLRRELFQQPVDLCYGVASPAGTAPQPYHHIQSAKPVAHLAERLAHQAFRAVAVDGPRRYPFARDDADAGIGAAVRPDEQREVAARTGGSEPEGRLELLSRQQSRAARQRGAGAAQTESRARPFARRARITFRPPRVRMRTRKPCVRLRRVFDG